MWKRGISEEGFERIAQSFEPEDEDSDIAVGSGFSKGTAFEKMKGLVQELQGLWPQVKMQGKQVRDEYEALLTEYQEIFKGTENDWRNDSVKDPGFSEQDVVSWEQRIDEFSSKLQ
jgi:hypothetical protein